MFESPLMPFRSLRVFGLSPTPQFRKQYEYLVIDRVEPILCERIVLARESLRGCVLPREVELGSQRTGLPGGEV